MIINLNSLNESLDRLYKPVLTEAFNDSFPKWLKDRLVLLRKFHGTDKGSDYEGRQGLSYKEMPSYISPRGHAGTDKSLSLFDNLLKNVDIDNLKVIEGPLPAKRTDERVKEPNIPIWGFSNGQVYIPGFNDNEEGFLPDGTARAFKYIPFKTLLSMASHFAYIDGSSIRDSKYLDVRSERSSKAKELRDLNYGRVGHDPKQFRQPKPSRYTNDKAYIDASGYIADPKRLIDKLDKLKASKYAEFLDDYYKTLLDYREDIISALQYYDPREDQKTYRKLTDLLMYFTRAVNEYNDISQRIESVVNSNYSDDTKQVYITSYISQLRENSDVKRLKDMGNDIFLGSADWLV